MDVNFVDSCGFIFNESIHQIYVSFLRSGGFFSVLVSIIFSKKKNKKRSDFRLELFKRHETNVATMPLSRKDVVYFISKVLKLAAFNLHSRKLHCKKLFHS